MPTVKARYECNQDSADRIFTETYFERCMRLEARNQARIGSYHEYFINRGIHRKFDTCGKPWCQSNMHYAGIDADGFPYGPVYHCIDWLREKITEFKTWEKEYSDLPF